MIRIHDHPPIIRHKMVNKFCFIFIFIIQLLLTNKLIGMDPYLPKSGMSAEMWKMMGDVGLKALNNEKARQAILAGAKGASTFTTAAEAAFGVTGCAYNMWSLAKDLKSYVAPTEAQKTRTIAVEEMLEFHKSKKALQRCLIDNASYERESSGRPRVCENEAHRFAMTAGDEGLDEITTVFNNSYTE